MNTTRHTHDRIPWITALIVGISVAIHLCGLDDTFEYRRGHWLGMATCHLSHYSWSHIAWSLGTFALLGTVCELRGRGRFCLCLVCGAATIPVGLSLFQPSLLHYRGISGIDSALFFLLAVEIAVRERFDCPGLSRGAFVLMCAFASKVLFEHFTRSAVFADSSGGAFVPAPLSHLIGAAVGAVSAMRVQLPCRAEASL